MGGHPNLIHRHPSSRLPGRGPDMDAKQYIAGLPQWDRQAHLAGLDKDALLAAEVTLPVAPGFVGRLASIEVRRPYHDRTELIAVDVSRLPVP